MTAFVTDVHVRASPGTVWQVLADIGAIDRWNPGLVVSDLTTSWGRGIRAARQCELGDANFLEEEVSEWRPGRRLTMRVMRTNFPFHRAKIQFRLKPEAEGTRVEVSPSYRLKYGLLGELLDCLYVRRSYRRGMEALLQGLKE